MERELSFSNPAEYTVWPLNFAYVIVLANTQSSQERLKTESLSNEDGKKQSVEIGITTTLHVHYVFLYISLPSLRDYNVEVPNFTFCRGRGL